MSAGATKCQVGRSTSRAQDHALIEGGLDSADVDAEQPQSQGPGRRGIVLRLHRPQVRHNVRHVLTRARESLIGKPQAENVGRDDHGVQCGARSGQFVSAILLTRIASRQIS